MVHLGSLGFNLVNLGLVWCALVHLSSLGIILVYFSSLWFTWVHLVYFGSLGFNKIIWAYVHFGLLAFIWRFGV